MYARCLKWAPLRVATPKYAATLLWSGERLWLLCGFDALEFFAGFEADGFAGRDADFFAGAGVASDAGLAGLDAEDAEAAELDALAAAESLLEGFEDRFDCLLGFGAADESFGDNRIHDVQLDHTRLLLLWQMLEGGPQVVKTRWVNYTVFPFGELLFALQNSFDD
jgi:hypothetical protein